MERPLGIDFSSILAGLRRQVGWENRAKRLPKSIQKACKIAWKNSMEKSRQKDDNLEAGRPTWRQEAGNDRATPATRAECAEPIPLGKLGRPGKLGR